MSRDDCFQVQSSLKFVESSLKISIVGEFSKLQDLVTHSSFLLLFLRAEALLTALPTVSIIRTPLYKSPGRSYKAMLYDPKFPLSVERSIFLLRQSYFGIMGTLSYGQMVTIYSRTANIVRSSWSTRHQSGLHLGHSGERRAALQNKSSYMTRI